MSIEQHVPSLETCRRMKEAGYNRKTLFCSYDTRKAHKVYNQKDGEFIAFDGLSDGNPELETYPRSYGDILKPSEGYNDSQPLARPLLSEILEELTITSSKIRKYAEMDEDAEDYLQIKYCASDVVDVTSCSHKNPAEAAALLWIKLVEEGVIIPKA